MSEQQVKKATPLKYEVIISVPENIERVVNGRHVRAIETMNEAWMEESSKVCDSCGIYVKAISTYGKYLYDDFDLGGFGDDVIIFTSYADINTDSDKYEKCLIEVVNALKERFKPHYVLIMKSSYMRVK